MDLDSSIGNKHYSHWVEEQGKQSQNPNVLSFHRQLLPLLGLHSALRLSSATTISSKLHHSQATLCSKEF